MGYDIHTQPHLLYDKANITLDGNHEMYFQQSGNPDGQAVVVLHGGPGAGIDQWQRCVFNPLHYRIIEFDQRGAGSSTPYGDLTTNTTPHLIADIEKLREHLNISKWLVMGGSWGSALALAYAQQFPDRVSAMLLRGIFLCSRNEIDWYLNGIQTVFPEAWYQFITFLPKEEQSNPLQSYKKRLTNSNPEIHIPAARAWCYYEAKCSTMLPEHTTNLSVSDQQALTLARIQVHYFDAGFFISDKSLIVGINRIRSIPACIVQGRYDMICPITSANKLHDLWPEADYKIVPNAGHAASEPGIRRALSAAARSLQQTSPITNAHGAINERATQVNI